MPESPSSPGQDDRLDQAESLPDLFRQVARKYGTLSAVRAGERDLTYDELDRLSDRLASRLVHHGVRSGDRVGLLIERSAHLPIAVLGALKAGAAYIPLDPSYPATRLRYIVEDAGVLVVVGPREDEHVDGLEGCQQLTVETDSLVPPLPMISISRSDLAYVIHTSGSTGDPKGCMVSHGSVLAFMRAVLTKFDLDHNDRIALFHPFVFDASVFELWAALATGATAVVAPPGATQHLPDFLNLLLKESVTFNSQVPTSFRALVAAYDDAGRPPLALRYLVLGGEPVELDVVARFLSSHPEPGPTVVNVYGPTEATCISTCRALKPADLDGSIRSPIGWALPHLQVEIRDADLKVLPDGSIGELVVAGAGVAMGYLGRPELTAERFVVLDGPKGRTRYYRTGDLARRLPDGSFEYVGRNDDQVKVRGVRIELGEVEAALRSSDLVADGAATVVHTSIGAQFLVACVVLADRNSLETSPPMSHLLREHMLRTVPRFLVPDRFQFLDALPMTGTFKLDRRALLEIAQKRPAPATIR